MEIFSASLKPNKAGAILVDLLESHHISCTEYQSLSIKSWCLFTLRFVTKHISNFPLLQVNTEKGCFSGHPALRDLALIYSTLGLPSPGSEDEIPDIFDTIIHKINDMSKKNSIPVNDLLGDPILKLSLKPEEWQKLEEVSHVLNEEYTIRFKTLLKRSDLTLTSFKWGKNAKVGSSLVTDIAPNLLIL